MNLIETLEINRRKDNIKNSYMFLFVQKILVEQNFDWVKLNMQNNKLSGVGVIKPDGCKRSYEIEIEYSPLEYRYERIYVRNPNIRFNPKIHMYRDDSLCLYYPKDHLYPPPLYKMLSWVSEWLVKYEFFQRKGVWIGNEFKH